MRPSTVEQRRRLYLQARVVIARHYRGPLTHAAVARALASSPRQLTRAFAQFGEIGFHEELSKRRLNVAAQLLIEQPAISVRDVARLVGFRQASHFAWSFRNRYGLTPAAFRAEGRAYARGARSQSAGASTEGAGTARAPASPACGAGPAKASHEPVCPRPSATRPAPRREDAGASGCRPPARVGR
jgi:AraC-like DNA-binding protein